MRKSFLPGRLLCAVLPVTALFVTAAPRVACAQSAEQIVRKVVGNELYYGYHDHSSWMFLDTYKSPTKNQVKLVIQTSQGNLSEITENYGRPPSAQEHQADLNHMQQIVNSPSMRAQQRRSEEHDDQQAANLLKILPDAFVWQIDSRQNGQIRLSYHPNSNYSPPSMSARVFAAMSGTMVVDEDQMRLADLFGRLTHSVEFGWGLLGHIDAGGTFQVIRSQIAPYEWQITQTHVHISGHALFFKNIGDQEDEVTSDYHRVPADVDLAKAEEMLRDGQVARELGLSTDLP
ncbi:MAG TPA: hypothetical protein VMD25_01585 [Acidobacteriaceae bacterium]|nr:hypothetical protein [Acidobacteriaceae bacterium]